MQRILAIAIVNSLALAAAGQVSPKSSSRPELQVTSSDAAKRGLELIFNYRFLPRDFHQSTFDELWRDWPEPLRSEAEKATPAERTKMAFQRYGFSPRENDPNRPLQFVVDSDGWWAMNCFTCHAGRVSGKPYLGSPNSLIALETMYDDLRTTKKRLDRPLNEMDLGSMVVPMGTTRGTSNAVIFGIALMAFRDKHLDVQILNLPPRVTHHDMDAPAWWNVSRRRRLYIDGFVEKNHRALIPFVMDRRNSGEKMRGWDDEFQDVYAYIESIQPPPYPWEIDHHLAKDGANVFKENCARCHGNYGRQKTYPGKVIRLQDIGTDPVRLAALTADHRRGYHESWFAHYGADDTVVEPKGYQAPPLDGVWASAPYFHNGSAATLWHVLHPKKRPKIWKRRGQDAFDIQRIGLLIDELDQLPQNLTKDQRREFFDTSVLGKSAAGHDYAGKLDARQRRALLEYLKTL